MRKIVVVYNESSIGHDKIGTREESIKTTGEEIVINEAAETWRFADSNKFSIWGSFPFGKGPTQQQQHERYWYVDTLTVFDMNNTSQLEDVFRTIRSDLPVGFGSDSACD